MKQLMSLPLSQKSLKEYTSWTALQEELTGLGCDGIEGIWSGEPFPMGIPDGLVQGYHLVFFQDWMDLWNGNNIALAERFGSLERAAAWYGGLNRDVLVEAYRNDLHRAKELGAQYVVFHVANVSLQECFTYHFSYANRQVIEASVELINMVMQGECWPFELLVENQWWPGFTFTEPRETELLLDGIQAERKGIVLDTGHLMNCCTNLRSQLEGIEYLHSMLNKHGSLCRAIHTIHLHQSLSGKYVAETTGKLPAKWPQEFEQQYALAYRRIQQIDCHQPWTERKILTVLERIEPQYLTHELISRTRIERSRAVWQQIALLKRKTNENVPTIPNL